MFSNRCCTNLLNLVAILIFPFYRCLEDTGIGETTLPPNQHHSAVLKISPIHETSPNALNSTVFLGNFRPSSRSSGRGGVLDESSMHHLMYPLRQSSRGGSPLTPEIKSHCFRQQATCHVFIEQPRPSCLGVPLPYKTTSFTLVGMNDSSVEEVEAQLMWWTRLQRVPRCWAVVQALLCALFMPRCEGGYLTLPSQELCRVTRGPCRLLDKYHPWPDYLSCQDESLFPTDCKQEVKDLKFNTSSGQCQLPLVETEQVGSWFPLVEGCGLQCHHPLVTREQHKQVHSFIGIAGAVCLSLNLFAVLSFLIDWHSARRYPGVIVCYINFCYLMACIGWLAQFSNEARKDIVCNNDGTLRKEQPNTTETWSCAAVFILIYAFLMSAALWFVVLSYSWHFIFIQRGDSSRARKVLRSKSGYVHVVVWSFAAILTVSIMAMGLVEGNSVYGICFVSYSHWPMRALFVLLPILVSLLVGGFFLSRGLISLLKVKFGSNNVTNDQAKTRINGMIWKIGLFMFFMFTSVIIVIVSHIYEYINKEFLEESLQDYVMCLILGDSSTPCRPRATPNLLLVYLQLMAMFGSGVAISSWVWTSASIDSWRRLIQRLCGGSKQEPVKLKRHKMIAQAFAHRREYNQVDKISLSYECTHADPVGMNLETNSVASRELSSTWAAMLPKMLLRRGAIVGPSTVTLGFRRYSSTSDLSQCTVQLGPLGSRRHSLDSQCSQQISEKEWLAHVRALARHRKRKTRKEREKLVKHHHRASPWALFTRRSRSSDTSQQTAPSAVPDVVTGNQKVSRATSTRDLPLFSVARPPVVFPVSRPLIQRQRLLIPPFTHGMAEGPIQPGRHIFHTRHTAPPPTSYCSSMWVPPYAYHAYPAYALVPMGLEPSEPILPLNPMPDTASEGDFIPIILSDSDFTDAGFRSANEERHLLDAQKVVQRRIDAITCRDTTSLSSNRPVSCCTCSSGKGPVHVVGNPLSVSQCVGFENNDSTVNSDQKICELTNRPASFRSEHLENNDLNRKSVNSECGKSNGHIFLG